MASTQPASFEMASSVRGHPWDNDKKVVSLFGLPYTILDFLNHLDKYRLLFYRPETPTAVKIKRLFFTFSSLHFLLRQIETVNKIGISPNSEIDPFMLQRSFSNCCEYFTRFTQLLKVIEEQSTATTARGEPTMTTEFIDDLLKNEQMTALEQRVREDFIHVRFLLMVLRMEGLDITASRLQRMFGIYYVDWWEWGLAYFK